MLVQRWLGDGLEYIPRWLALQMRQREQPGCAVALTHKGRLAMEHAFGHADQNRQILLTPRHRFRVASHSTSFTAAGRLTLREQGRGILDQAVADFLPVSAPRTGPGHARPVAVTQRRHTVRDEADAGQWQDRRPFLDEAAIRADPADAPVNDGKPFASGHSAKVLLGRDRVPANNCTHAMASAAGFVSTAADLARFFAGLLPTARSSVLCPASRREMTRRQWPDPHSSIARCSGLGSLAGGCARHGEPARLLRNAKVVATALSLGGSQLVPESRAARAAREVTRPMKNRAL